MRTRVCLGRIKMNTGFFHSDFLFPSSTYIPALTFGSHEINVISNSKSMIACFKQIDKILSLQ